MQTESESSDANSDADEEKPSEQIASESDESADDKTESEISSEQSDSSDEEHKASDDEKSEDTVEAEATEADSKPVELVEGPAAIVEQNESIDMDEIRYKNLKVIYQGRDILDFGSNVANQSWNVQYAHLPEQNYQMYMNNRSQYNRLAPGYESPENYSLNACSKCTFHFPVLVDIPHKIELNANSCKTNVNDLLTYTLASLVSRDSPVPTVNNVAQKMSAQSMGHGPTGQSVNMNNFMLNNNLAAAAAAATSGQANQYTYQNRNQFANNAANNAANLNHYFKPNSNANSTYNNNAMLNALVNQLGNMNNSSAFNSNVMSAINGTNANNQLNQLSSLANLMNQNRQQHYGVCRQNINKSGINFNTNSHKPMPTYSHF